MAVYCGACGTRLDSAMENEGSFQTAPGFKGWDVREGQTSARISDTCASCHKILGEAVTKAANEIAAKHAPQIKKLRKEIETAREREATAKKEKAEFERAWQAQRAGR